MQRGRESFNKHKKTIVFLSRCISILPRKMRVRLLDANRMARGKRGLLVRYLLIRTLAAKCGDNVSIHQGVYVFSPEKLSLGSNVSIHPMSYIDATGGVSIGDDVSIAHGVTIMSTSHNYTDKECPIKDQGVVCKQTTVESNVWIGAKATILAGVVVGSGVVVAANAVVTKSTESDVIVGGVPASTIKRR